MMWFHFHSVLCIFISFKISLTCVLLINVLSHFYLFQSFPVFSIIDSLFDDAKVVREHILYEFVSNMWVLRPMLEGLPWPGAYCDRIPLTWSFWGGEYQCMGTKRLLGWTICCMGHPCSRSSQTPRCLSVKGVFQAQQRRKAHFLAGK